MYKIFIDGAAGTTGLRIHERLAKRKDLTILKIKEELRKDNEERARLINSSDITFLCLPDVASREAVSLVTNPSVKIIDASTAHRTIWDYGLPELSKKHYEDIKESNRVSVPGCHASCFIALVYPLLVKNFISNDFPLTCMSITGYSGGGNKMIDKYEGKREDSLNAPIMYALAQKHKHIKEIMHHCKLKIQPVFNPIVAPYYNGMLTTISFHGSVIGKTLKEVYECLNNHYDNQPLIKVLDIDNEINMSANILKNRDIMEIIITGSNDCINITSRIDNLGKGASGAAIQCMNIMLGINQTEGLII